MPNTDSHSRPATLFELLPEEVWDALRLRMDLRTFEVGDIIVAQGAMEPPFQVIIEGTALVMATSQHGERLELGRLGFGECVGEMALLTGEPASADVVAASRVQTYAATPARLAGLGELRSRLIEALSTTLAGRLKHANQRLLALHPARTHVIYCEPLDIVALARLPEAIVHTGAPRVAVLLVGDNSIRASEPALFGADGVTVRAVSGAELNELPHLLEQMAREFDEMIVFATVDLEAQAPNDAASIVRIVREERGDYRPSGRGDAEQALVIENERWTRPALRRLTSRLGRQVIGIVPPDASTGEPSAPISKLARVLTRRQIGVALGAGAAKGLAHLGVLRAFDELGVPIDVIAGCSIGSPIAAGVAAGMTVDELMEATGCVAAKAVRLTLPVRSFLSNAGLKEGLRELAGERLIEDLDLPLAIMATDLFRRTAVTFTTGLVWPRMLASMAIPGVYPPSAAMGSYLVDGSVLHPVPVRPCRDLGAGIVIGVRLTGSRTSPRDDLEEKPTRPLAIETIMRSLEIMVNHLSEVSHEAADVSIEVCVDGGGGVRDFKRGDEIAAIGYRAAMSNAGALATAMPYVRTGAA